MSISDWLIGVTGFWFVSGADTEDRPSLTPPELGGLVVEAFARAAENGTGTECAFAQRPGRGEGPQWARSTSGLGCRRAGVHRAAGGGVV